MMLWKRALAFGMCCSMIMISSFLPTASGSPYAIYGAGSVEKVQPGTDFSGTPYIVMDSHGNAIALWVQIYPNFDLSVPRLDLYANRYVASSGWGTAKLLCSDEYIRYGIAMNPQGDAVVAWAVSNQASKCSVYTSIYNDLSGWGDPQNIYNGTGSPMDPQVAIGSSEEYAVAWACQNYSVPMGPYTDIFVFHQAPGSSGKVYFTANEFNITFVSSMAVDARGNVTATWMEGQEFMVTASRYVIGTGWEETRTMDETPFTTGLADVMGPQISMNSKGDALLAWSREINGDNGLFACIYSTGSGWRDVVQLQDQYEELGEYQATIGDDGTAVVAWIEFNRPYSSVHVVKFDASTGWGTPLELRNDTTIKEYPAVLIEPNGDVITLWTRPSGSGQLLYQYCVQEGADVPSSVFTYLPFLAMGLRDYAVSQDGSILYVWAGMNGEQAGEITTLNIYSAHLPGSLEIGGQSAEKESGSRTIIAVSSAMAAALTASLIFGMRKRSQA